MRINIVDIVVPCYNEEANLEALMAALHQELDGGGWQWCAILVDDGSRDRTAELIDSLSASDPSCRGLIFSRNFGKEAAMLAGLHASTADAVIIMDADLQHPPRIIPQLIEEAKASHADQVIACRDRTGESWLRASLSRLYYATVNRLLDNVRLQNGAGDFRLLSRRAVDTLLELSERTRFSKGLFSWIGYPTSSVHYTNESRFGGESSWSFKSLFNYGVDGITAFSTKPLRLVAHFGMWMILFGVAYLVALLIAWLINGVTAPGYITTISAVVVFSGVQLFALGVIGEYIGKIYQEVKARPHYVVMTDTNDSDQR